MKLHRSLAISSLAIALATSAFAQENSPQLTHVLKQMDTASASFQRATADFRWDLYEKIVHDTTTDNGSIYFERQGNSTTMGAVVLAPAASGKEKYAKVLEYKNGALQIFDTGVDQITVVAAGANQAQYEGFLTLGFGGSGTELNRTWKIQDLGSETLTDDGKPVVTEKLDLTPRDSNANNMFTHITVWIDLTRDVSLKQVFYTASGNYRTATYTHIQVNGNVHKDHFAIKKDKNTTVVNH
jgi:outer membrane lipoprotein-sorting protein